MFNFLSVCAGIEAVSVAWGPLGAKPVAFAQYDPEHNYSRKPDFASRVLAHHWPHVPNLGDMTKIDGTQYHGTDVLVGGTPCQAYSVAGLRQGLADPRGNLTLTFAKLVHEMEPKVVLWENVPGVLTSDDNAFGCFLSALCGNDLPAIPEPQPLYEECNFNAKTPTTTRKNYRWSKRTGRFIPKWPTVGYVAGPDRICAWRVLDAQFFGVAQRRRRVFLVSVDTRSGLCPGKILFESESLQRDTPPSRETRQEVTRTVRNRSHWDGEEHPHPTINQCHNTGGIGQSNQELFSQRGAGLVATYCLQGSMVGRSDTAGPQGSGVNEDISFTLNTTDRHAVCVGTLDTECGYQSQAFQSVASGHIIGTITARMFNALGARDVEEGALQVEGVRARKLTPVECERLQGFPDNHTNIPGAGDGPRYKAIGNSMAVPVMRWLGVRIIMALEGLI